MPSARKSAVKAYKAARKERRQAERRRQFMGKARAAERREAKYIVVIRAQAWVRWDDSEDNKRELTEWTLQEPLARRADAQDVVDEAVRKYLEDTQTQYKALDAGVRSVTHEVLAVKRAGPGPEHHRMREAYPLRLDGDPLDPATWNARIGMCVFNYLLHKYGETGGFKKMCASPTTIALAMLGYWVHPDEDTHSAPRGDTQGAPKGERSKRKYGHFTLDVKKPLPPEVQAQVEDLFRHGVQTVPHMVNFAVAARRSLYACDQDDPVPFYVHKLEAARRSHNATNIAYRIVSNHMYPIEERLVSVAGVAASRATGFTHGRMYFSARARGPGADEEQKKKSGVEPVIVDLPEREDGSRVRGLDYMLQAMQDSGTQVFKYKTLVYDGKDVVQFELDKKLYVLKPDAYAARALMAGLGEEYGGESLTSALLAVMQAVLGKERRRSRPNPHVLESLVAVKNRTHRGYFAPTWPFVEAPDLAAALREHVVQLLEAGKAQAYDISKCYPTALCAPLEDWMDLNFYAEYQPYAGPQPGDLLGEPLALPLGLYTVETQDALLLHGRHLYSSGILNFAAQEKIRFRIVSQLRATGRQDAALYRRLMARVVQLCGCDPRRYKHCNNCLTGMLGKDKRTRRCARLTEDADQMHEWLFKRLGLSVQDVFVHRLEAGERTVFFHGFEETRRVTEVDIPHYIQMLDAANVQLYKMVRRMGGRLLYRNVDMAIATRPGLELREALPGDDVPAGPSLPAVWNQPERGGRTGPKDARRKPRVPRRPPAELAWVDTLEGVPDEVKAELRWWGAYRRQTAEQVPRKLVTQDLDRGLETLPAPAAPWQVVPDVSSSGDWAKLLPRLSRGGSMMLTGGAGTGKTYAANHLIAELEAQGRTVARLAFSNTAAAHLRGGETIHHFLRMDIKGNMSRAVLKLVEEGVHLVVVDEISMVPGYVWEALVEAKRQLGCAFLLIGDPRQCSPPESVPEAPEDYFDHSAVKWLAENTRAALTVRQRFDQALGEMLDRLDHEEIRRRTGRAETAVNICMFNITRIYVNDVWMRRRRPEGALLLQANPFDEQTQDTWVYPGLPVMGRRNVYDTAEVERRKVELAELRAQGLRPPRAKQPLLLANSERFTVLEVLEDAVVVGNASRPAGPHTAKVALADFLDWLQPAYCVTVEKSQGDTIREPITVYDLRAMNDKRLYTALSRVTRLADVNLGTLPPGAADASTRIRRNVEIKVRSVVADDLAKGRAPPGLTAEHMLALRRKMDAGTCPVCAGPLLWANYERRSRHMASIDRLRDQHNENHNPGNVRWVCWGCNRARNKQDVADCEEFAA